MEEGGTLSFVPLSVVFSHELAAAHFFLQMQTGQDVSIVQVFFLELIFLTNQFFIKKVLQTHLFSFGSKGFQIKLFLKS